MIRLTLPKDDVCEFLLSNMRLLKYIQTYDICMEVIKQNGLALQYVKRQTDDICMCAIKQNENALKYVEEQSYDICM